jgi:hypothetical protein
MLDFGIRLPLDDFFDLKPAVVKHSDTSAAYRSANGCYTASSLSCASERGGEMT